MMHEQPVASVDAWFYRDANQERVGPVSSERLRRLVVEGVIRWDTAVRRGRDGEWVAAQAVAGLDVLAPKAGSRVAAPAMPMGPPETILRPEPREPEPESPPRRREPHPVKQPVAAKLLLDVVMFISVLVFIFGLFIEQPAAGPVVVFLLAWMCRLLLDVRRLLQFIHRNLH